MYGHICAERRFSHRVNSISHVWFYFYFTRKWTPFIQFHCAIKKEKHTQRRTIRLVKPLRRGAHMICMIHQFVRESRLLGLALCRRRCGCGGRGTDGDDFDLGFSDVCGPDWFPAWIYERRQPCAIIRFTIFVFKTKAQCPIRNFTAVYSTECRCKLYALRQEMLWQVVGQVSFTQFGTCTCTCVVLCKIYIRNNTILGWFIKKGSGYIVFFTRTIRFTQNGAYFVC